VHIYKYSCFQSHVHRCVFAGLSRKHKVILEIILWEQDISVASGWLIYLKCMMMHGLANFKFKNFID